MSKHPLYSQDGKGKEAVIVCKFFNPCGAGTWYVLEGEKQDCGGWLFYGIVNLHEIEYGYFTLAELECVKLPFGLTIERDLYFGTPKVGEVKELAEWLDN